MTIQWNYRVFLEENGDYIIREVFYSETGSILGCTENAVEPWGESLEELTQNIEWFQEALALPVLTLADLPEQPIRSPQKSDRSDNISHDRLMAELGLAESSSTS
ncbi:MAG: hypothetical protein SWY16_14180 [Cyanobacteriota bacterium]|nr:hypothetical protein [Cyanobacteriota bacterium]